MCCLYLYITAFTDQQNRVLSRRSYAQSRTRAGDRLLGCFKALQWAGCFHSFAQRHQLRRVSEQREEDPQLDELCIRNLDLEEVDSPLLNLQAAAGRVRASGIAVGASKRDASRHLCQHVDDNEPIEWRELRTHVVRNTQIRAPRRSIHIIGYMLVLHRGCRCSMHPDSKFDRRALVVASYQLCSCRVEVRVDPFPSCCSKIVRSAAPSFPSQLRASPPTLFSTCP